MIGYPPNPLPTLKTRLFLTYFAWLHHFSLVVGGLGGAVGSFAYNKFYTPHLSAFSSDKAKQKAVEHMKSAPRRATMGILGGKFPFFPCFFFFHVYLGYTITSRE